MRAIWFPDKKPSSVFIFYNPIRAPNSYTPKIQPAQYKKISVKESGTEITGTRRKLENLFLVHVFIIKNKKKYLMSKR